MLPVANESTVRAKCRVESQVAVLCPRAQKRIDTSLSVPPAHIAIAVQVRKSLRLELIFPEEGKTSLPDAVSLKSQNGEVQLLTKRPLGYSSEVVSQDIDLRPWSQTNQSVNAVCLTMVRMGKPSCR